MLESQGNKTGTSGMISFYIFTTLSRLVNACYEIMNLWYIKP